MDLMIQQLTDLVARSPISGLDRMALLDALSMSGDTMRAAVALFSRDIAWVQKLSANLKEKSEAVAKKDMSAWKRIVDDEMKQLAE